MGTPVLESRLSRFVRFPPGTLFLSRPLCLFHILAAGKPAGLLVYRAG